MARQARNAACCNETSRYGSAAGSSCSEASPICTAISRIASRTSPAEFSLADHARSELAQLFGGGVPCRGPYLPRRVVGGEEARRDRRRDAAARAAASRRAPEIARSPRKQMNQACVGRRVAAAELGGAGLARRLARRRGERGARAARHDLAHERADRAEILRGRTGRRRGAGRSSGRRGARQRPFATVAATPAIASGVATIRSCPIIIAAWLTASPLGGTCELAVPNGRSVFLPSPNSSAVVGQRRGGQLRRERDEGGVARDREVLVEARRAAALALEVPERAPVDDDRRGTRHRRTLVEAVLEQRHRRDHLEGRPGRVGTGQGAVERRCDRAIRDRQDVAGRRLHGDDRRRGGRRAEGGLRSVLRTGGERGAKRNGSPALVDLERPQRVAGLATADDDADVLRAGEVAVSGTRPRAPTARRRRRPGAIRASAGSARPWRAQRPRAAHARTRTGASGSAALLVMLPGIARSFLATFA